MDKDKMTEELVRKIQARSSYGAIVACEEITKNIAVITSISVFQRYVRMNDFHMIHNDWAVNNDGDVYYCVDVPQKAHGRRWNGKMILTYNDYYRKIYDEIFVQEKE